MSYSHIYHLAKQWTPPALMALLRWARDHWQGTGCHYTGRNWPAAPAGGWESGDIIAPRRAMFAEWARQIVLEKPLVSEWPPRDRDSLDLFEHNRHMCAVLAVAKAAGGKSELSVLDWGGACGDYALLAWRNCPETLFQWNCAELPAICALGRDLNPKVNFIPDERWKQSAYDLGFSSSAIQYVEDWRGVLAALAAVSKDWLFITRVPVVLAQRSFVFVQKVPRYGTQYPGWAFNRDELVGLAEQAGFRVAQEFLLGKWMRVHGAPEQPLTMGFLFRRIGGSPVPAEGGPYTSGT